eukprot:GEMP01009899.1.p1 GENE.GEMP01009899.1~~GEMP01009899.1.p1  ORF type:complete len:551 (+),score=151.01 GEMP01009899.1:133-1785(+)
MEVVVARFLTGDSVRLEGCCTVGDVMIQVATDHDRMPSDVVVFPMGTSDVLAHDCPVPRQVSIVFKKEETPLSVEESKTNAIIYAAAGDAPGLQRALGMLRAVRPDHAWGGEMMYDLARETANAPMLRTFLRIIDPFPVLWRAASWRNVPVLDTLLGAGLDVHARYINDETIFTHVAAGGSEEMMDRLLAHHADINHANKYGYTALMQICATTDAEMITMLLSRGANVNSEYTDVSARKVMRPRAVTNIRKENVSNWQARTTYVYTKSDARGEIAVACATLAGKPQPVYTSSAYMTSSPLTEACLGNPFEIEVAVGVLLRAKADIDWVDNFGDSALMNLCDTGGDGFLVDVLLSAHADINLTNYTGNSALTLAAERGSFRTVELLLSRRADVHCTNIHGYSALMTICHDGGEGFDNEMKTFGMSAEDIAEAKKMPNTLDVLLAGGADVNCTDPYGNSALAVAFRHGQDEVVKKLLRAGAVWKMGESRKFWADMVKERMEFVDCSEEHISGSDDLEEDLKVVSPAWTTPGGISRRYSPARTPYIFSSPHSV